MAFLNRSFSRFPPIFKEFKELADLPLIVQGGAIWVFYPTPSPGRYELRPFAYSEGVFGDFSDQLWDLQLDYKMDYRLIHWGQEGLDDDGNPPDLEKVYIQISTQVVPFTLSNLDYNYLPKGDHDDGTAPPFGWTEVAWPDGVDPPYEGYDLFSVSAGPGVTDGDIAGTNYYYRPDIGPTAFSIWHWTATGQDTIVQDFKTDFETHTFADEIVDDLEVDVLAIIEPNFQSATDTRVIHESDPDDPTDPPSKVIYHAGLPDDAAGNDGDYWVDTTKLPFVIYGPRAITWPTEPISSIPDEVGQTYRYKMAQVISGLYYHAALLEDPTNRRRLWFFDSERIKGVWAPIILPTDPPPYLPEAKPIRDGDYRPEPDLLPFPQPKQSPYPGFRVAVFLPEDINFPVGGLTNTENDFNGSISNPVAFEPGDLCGGDVTTNPHVFSSDPDDSDNEILESDSVNWTGPAGETQIALLKRRTASKKYHIVVSSIPFS